jgi:hypothetical protein
VLALDKKYWKCKHTVGPRTDILVDMITYSTYYAALYNQANILNWLIDRYKLEFRKDIDLHYAFMGACDGHHMSLIEKLDYTELMYECQMAIEVSDYDPGVTKYIVEHCYVTRDSLDEDFGMACYDNDVNFVKVIAKYCYSDVVASGRQIAAERDYMKIVEHLDGLISSRAMRKIINNAHQRCKNRRRG